MGKFAHPGGGLTVVKWLLGPVPQLQVVESWPPILSALKPLSKALSFLVAGDHQGVNRAISSLEPSLLCLRSCLCPLDTVLVCAGRLEYGIGKGRIYIWRGKTVSQRKGRIAGLTAAHLNENQTLPNAQDQLTA